MAGRIIRRPLFDEAEKRGIDATLAEMEAKAAQIIARNPDQRDAVCERLNLVAEQFVRSQVRRKRLEAIGAGGVMLVVGLLLIWLGDAREWAIVAVLGGGFMLSGIGTAVINGVILGIERMQATGPNR